jgi:UDP-N-acetylglucosamine--N-acetylmuramyl-(pentapeptide) pyrophosphoryl-undecaprenol N-acetylglucosamine transferase
VLSRGYEYFALPAVSTRDLRRRPLRSLAAAWRSYLSARRIVRRFGPAAVIGLGGFASVPTVLAASRMRVPVTLLEQNVVPGRATRWLSRRADRVCVAFEETRSALPLARACRLTGNPVRQIASPDAGRREELLLLVLGGSQGARCLNLAVPEALGRIGRPAAGWRVMHQCGEHDPAAVRAAYRASGWEASVEPFLELPPRWLARSDLVVARAGATTLAEIACVGVATVLVPYPHATDDHQRANANWFVERGAARMVEQSGGREMLAGALAEQVGALLGSEPRRREIAAAMRGLGRPAAAAAVVAVLAETLGEPGDEDPVSRQAA